MHSFTFHYIPLHSFHFTFPSLILDNFVFEKTPLNLGWQLKYLVISILFKGWRRTKNFYPYMLFLFF